MILRAHGRRRILAHVALAGGALLAPRAGAAGRPAPYAMPRTEVHHVKAAANGQEYVLYVALPRTLPPGQRVPVVYVLDADYSFAIARNVVDHFADREDLPPMIVVGVSYPGGIDDMDDYRRRRTRDYTPTHSVAGGYGPEIQKLSGGGPAFRDALERDLMPFVESRHPIDPKDRTLVGHSYGGLFATWVLLTKPALFRRYVAVSPSLWYDERMIFDVEKKTAKERRGVPADVFLCVGGFENAPMVTDLAELVAVLRQRGDPAVHVDDHVFEGETHDSVFPGAFTRGVLAVHGSQRRPAAEPSGLPGQVRLPEVPVVGGAPVQRPQQP
jgi:predicted alpha/beta superfamily hydrolase